MSKLENLLNAETADAPVYVSAYTVDRCYGGAEEGGWYYDWYTFVSVVATRPTWEEARAFANLLDDAQREQDREEGKRERWSVIGSADTVYIVENVPGEERSTERPYYC